MGKHNNYQPITLAYISEYTAFLNARQRCHNEDHPQYDNYGARGIHVCDDWNHSAGFESFLKHIGPKPSPDLTLDRIDNDRGYEHDNVRWATRVEQNMNRRPYRPRPSLLKRNRLIQADFKAGHAIDELTVGYSLTTSTIKAVLELGGSNGHLTQRNSDIQRDRNAGTLVSELSIKYDLSKPAIYLILRDSKPRSI